MAQVNLIKKGDPVEFTRESTRTHALGSGEVGIAIESERDDHSVTVELADGSTYRAQHIHAYGWGGWMPEELEAVYEKHNPELLEGDYGDY